MPARIFIFIFGLLVYSCTQKTEDYKPKDQVNDFQPMQVGKYITYRLDSTVFIRAGSQIVIRNYEVKHLVAATTTDNLNRPTYRVIRTIRPAGSNGEWKDNGSYFITPTPLGIEQIENNLRTIHLASPMLAGASWKGNAYMPRDPYQPLFDMQVGRDMNTWKFKYTGYGNETFQGQNYQEVWTVEQSNQVQYIPPPTPESYGSKQVSIEKYARNIGLVYRNLEIYEHQPPNTDNPQETYIGFGITMWMIDHN